VDNNGPVIGTEVGEDVGSVIEFDEVIEELSKSWTLCVLFAWETSLYSLFKHPVITKEYVWYRVFKFLA